MSKNNNKNIYFKDIFKWGDIFLILVIIIAIVLTIVFATKTGANMVEVYLDGDLKYKVSLSKNIEIPLLDGEVIVKVENNTVRISKSNCKNQICVETKAIGTEGGVIVCLPNKVLVKVTKAGPENITY